MAVKVVTDSTCELPKSLAEQWGITVIPCNVHFGDEVYKDGVDMGPDEFYSRLVSSPRLPTTAQPSVNDFQQVYCALLAGGHQVVSIHLSAKLSGTLNSATQAKQALGSLEPGSGRVEIIDSGMASLGLGLNVLSAARMAQEGASCDEVVTGVQESLPRSHCYFLLDTLEYLQKGGRIGKASAFLGSILNIKPILTIRDGEAHPAERARTREKGLQRLVDTVKGLAPFDHLGLIHSTTPEEAEALAGRFTDLMPRDQIVMGRFGPAVGTYLGPGALGIGLISSISAP